jgi:tRNA (guanosine-2'-O-)-methyltransferase
MKRYPDLNRQERVTKILAERRKDLALVLENLSEELNISAILRTAEAFGVGLVCIIHPLDKKPQISNNVSSGAKKWLDIRFYTSIQDCVKFLKDEKFKIVASMVDPEAQSLWETKLEGKIAIVVGSESKGISSEMAELSDLKLYLPMFGFTESLNVSVAAALFLYEAVRQKEYSKNF